VILGVDAGRAVGERTGVGRYVLHLLTAWSQTELPFETLRIFSPAPLEGFPDDPRFRYEVLPGPRSELAWQPVYLRRAAKDVNVLFGQYTLPLGFRGRGVINNLGIYEGALAIPGWQARLRSWHQKVSARQADAVIANSQSTKDDVVRFYGVDPAKIDVVWPGSAADDYRPAGPGDERAAPFGDAPYFLFVGKLSQRRNVPALVEAFALVQGEHPDFRLLIVGPNTSGVPVEELFLRFGVGGAARYEPFLGSEALAPLYRGAHAFVLPTEHEGFSGTIPEAIASACPVVTVDHAALADAGLRDAVLHVPSPDPALLAAAMTRTIEEPGLRERLAQAGLDVSKLLTWENCARGTMDVLARVGSAPDTSV
jgi:glycosyltransferase involved in cell wall biosynthesis